MAETEQQFQSYFEDYQKHHHIIRAIDDSLAIWLENAFPTHHTFEWSPLTNSQVEVWVKWFNPNQVEHIQISIAELDID